MKGYILTLVVVLLKASANACSCGAVTMRDSFKAADFVVEARVTSLTDTVHYDLYSNPIHPPFLSGNSPVLFVGKSYKGSLKPGEIVAVIGDYSMCSFYFHLNQTYIVFLFRNNKQMTTSVCQKNFLASDKQLKNELRKLL